VRLSKVRYRITAADYAEIAEHMKIVDYRIHSIAIADPPLRSSYGLHAPFALRTILELESDDGIAGISEAHGGDANAALFEAARPRVIGADPYRLAAAEAADAAEYAKDTRPLSDLSSSRREPGGRGRAAVFRARNRMPRSDRQVGG
jgi:hypothetical protein